MRILLIDIDRTQPNLALMKLSAYHKAKGDEVSLNNPNDPDIVYISCVFIKNRERALGTARFYPDAQIHIGGSGVNYSTLPEEVEGVMPDYGLYPNIDYSVGFTTRGCIRNCGFCIVRDKEGPLIRWHHPERFHNPEFKKIMIMDNNWMAAKDWFMETTAWIRDNNLSVIEHGLDIRIIDKEKADRLAELKMGGPLHFAFDSMEDEPAVRRGIKILRDAGIELRHNTQFYVLVGWDTEPEEDKYRCRLLKELGTNAFVMPYVKNKWTNKLARWANRKQLFWSIDIDDYDRSKYG